MVNLEMRGIFPIISMPFDAQGRIVYRDLEHQIEWLLGQGVHGLGIAMASEVFKLTESERDEVLTSVVKSADGRVPVVMNTGGEGTDVTIHYSRRAEELGADALMIRPTSYIPTTASEHVRYFEEVASSVTIPIFLQDQSTAPVPPGMAVECARRHENLCYIKVETPPTLPRVTEAKRLAGDDTNLIIFGGMGGAFFLEELARGSVGSMPGATMPDVFVQVWDLWQAGNRADAFSMFDRYASLIRILAQGQGLANWIYKFILYKRGVFAEESTYARAPSLRPDADHYAEIEAELRRAGLVDV